MDHATLLNLDDQKNPTENTLIKTRKSTGRIILFGSGEGYK